MLNKKGSVHVTKQLWRLIIFAFVLFVGLTMGVAQKRTATGTQDLFTEWTNLIISPFLTPVRASINTVQSLRDVFRLNSTLKNRVSRLEAENTFLRQKVIGTQEAREENRRLIALLKLTDSFDNKTIAARVSVRPSTPWADTCVLDKGSADSIIPGSAVVALGGLVGQIIKTSKNSSHVILLNHSNNMVDCLTQRTRAPGICKGQGSGELILDLVPASSDIKEGDAVISSGKGGIFPSGQLVGYVVTIEREEHSQFKRAVIRPAVEFRSVEEVLVVRPGR